MLLVRLDRVCVHRNYFLFFFVCFFVCFFVFFFVLVFVCFRSSQFVSSSFQLIILFTTVLGQCEDSSGAACEGRCTTVSEKSVCSGKTEAELLAKAHTATRKQSAPDASTETHIFGTRAPLGTITYSGGDLPVPAVGTSGSMDPADVVSNLPPGGIIDSLTVEIRIQHTWNEDLEIFMEHVDTGTRVELSTRNGVGGDGYINTVFDDSASSDIPVGDTVIGVGPFRPEGSLSDFSGELTDGTWRLDVFDNGGGDAGTLEAFSVTFDGTAALTASE
jgi:subtilisin-like proprotein convertase family protein